MAQLKFSGIRPVAFGERECTPRKLNTGDRLRLERIEFKSDADIEEADKVLSGCFIESDQDYVAEFLKVMAPNDKNILKSYLLNGEKAIAMLDRTSDVMAERAIDEMVKTAKEAKEQEAANE